MGMGAARWHHWKQYVAPPHSPHHGNSSSKTFLIVAKLWWHQWWQLLGRTCYRSCPWIGLCASTLLSRCRDRCQSVRCFVRRGEVSQKRCFQVPVGGRTRHAADSHARPSQERC